MGKINLIPIGTRFGRLRVVKFEGTNTRGQATFLCQCVCGERKIIVGRYLRRGNTRSCGCLAHEELLARVQTHGMSKSPEYQAYKEARKRCRNPKNKDFPSYGGRGIEFRFNSFEEFFAAIGPKKNSWLTLDRKDNNGHYEAGNITWASRSQNAKNRRPVTQWKALPGILTAHA